MVAESAAWIVMRRRTKAPKVNSASAAVVNFLAAMARRRRSSHGMVASEGGKDTKVMPRSASRILIAIVVATTYAASFAAQTQDDGGYRLVPNWPKLPTGMYFGLKDPPPPPAEREALAAARRA